VSHAPANNPPTVTLNAPPSPGEAHDSPWYRKAFGAGYLDLYAHRDIRDAAHAVEFLRRTVGLHREQRLLDLCCGPGRHLSQLAPLVGVAVGLDLSRHLLAQARAHCQAVLDAEHLPSPQLLGLVEGDMRHLAIRAASFDLVINMFTSFGYFHEESENVDVIHEIARVLAPGGSLVIDHINRTHLESVLQLDSERELSGGIRVIEKRRFDESARRVCKHVYWLDRVGGSTEWEESVRVYDRSEIEAMLTSAGLRVRESFGDYDGSPLAEDSPRMILVARREE